MANVESINVYIMILMTNPDVFNVLTDSKYIQIMFVECVRMGVVKVLNFY